MASFKLSLVAVLFCFWSAAPVDSVSVTLYYETLCPACQQFINDQLYPGYKALGDIVTINLIPYGNSRRMQNGTQTVIVCQHGPNECYGDKIHACGIQGNPQKVWLGFIACTTNSMHPYNVTIAERCANKFNLNWSKIKACADSEEGEKLVLDYGVITDKAAIRYTPHVVLNNFVDDKIEQLARDNFVKLICSMLDVKPEECKRY